MVGDIHGERGRLTLLRLKRGECPTCGMQLYRPHGIMGNRKTPLTIPGRVFEGRCLLCFPAEDNYSSESDMLRVPAVLTVDDDSTVVSAITIEHSFARPGETDYDCQSIDENGVLPPPANQRPEPSGFGDLSANRDHRPKMPSRGRNGHPEPPRRERPHRGPRNRPQLKIHAFPEEDEDDLHDSFSSRKFHNLPSAREQQQQMQQQYEEEVEDDNEHIVVNFRRRSRRSREEDELDRRSNHSSKSGSRSGRSGLSSSQSHEEEASGLTFPDARSMAPRHSLEELVEFLDQLQPNTNHRVDLLQQIAICVWDWKEPAKDIFRRRAGLETLATLLWTDMTNTTVVQEVAKLVLALAGTDGAPLLTQTTATEGLIDAFLITLHTLIHLQGLQETACRIFCCLSAAAGQVHDGTLSGALQSVLNAMDAHQNCPAIQEWGIRALYNQCVCSANAEPNKRSLASAVLNSGATGRDVLTRILENYPPSSTQVEWCAQLYWLLSASADLAEMLSPAAPALKEMQRLLRELHQREGCVPVQEALLGTMSNLMALDQNNNATGDLFRFVLDTMDTYKQQPEILHESCFLLVTLVQTEPDPRDASNGVRTLVTILKSPSFQETMLDPVLRSLSAARSTAAKETLLSDPHSLLSILKLCRSSLENAADCNSPELCCTLLASLFASEDERLHPRRRAIQTGAIEYVCDVMSRYRDSERLQDTACRALRNFSCFPECSELIFRNGAVTFLVDDLKIFRDATALHSNACCTLWNLKVHVGGAILTGDDIQCIVTTLQNHLEDENLVLMACGALWSNVCGSEELKRHLLATDGGVDSIACVLVMHPDNEQIVLSASGLLTGLTVKMEMVEGVVTTESFANMVDIMRDDNVSVDILKAGALFMRNVCLAFPEFADEAASVVPPMVQAMKNNAENAAFQKEACSFMWLVAALSANAKSKILALDGVTTLMMILESYSGVEENVEEVARGAFRELALSTTGF